MSYKTRAVRSHVHQSDLQGIGNEFFLINTVFQFSVHEKPIFKTLNPFQRDIVQAKLSG